MPAILKSDRKHYVARKHYRGGRFHGGAAWLPRKRCDGDGFLDLLKLVVANKDNIMNGAQAVGSIIDTTGKVANTAIDVVKNIKALRGNGATGGSASSNGVYEIPEYLLQNKHAQEQLGQGFFLSFKWQMKYYQST